MNFLNFFNIGFKNKINNELDSLLSKIHEIQAINLKLLSDTNYSKKSYQILPILNVCYGEIGLIKKTTQLDFPIVHIEHIESRYIHKEIQNIFELVDVKNKLTLSIEKKKWVSDTIKQSLKLSNKEWTIHRVHNQWSNKLNIEENQYKKLNKLTVLMELKEYNLLLQKSLNFYHMINLLFEEKMKENDAKNLIDLLTDHPKLLSVITILSKEREQAILIPLLKEKDPQLSIEKIHQNLNDLYKIGYDWGKDDMYPANDLTEVLNILGKMIKGLENKDEEFYQSIHKIIFKEELFNKLQCQENNVKSTSIRKNKI